MTIKANKSYSSYASSSLAQIARKKAQAIMYSAYESQPVGFKVADSKQSSSKQESK